MLVADLSLLDGPTGCDPCFCVVWFRFRLLRRYLALWPAEVGRIYRILGMVGEGCPGHGPIHLLSASATEIGFRWDPLALAWVRPGLLLLSNLAGPIQHFRAALLDAWRNRVAAGLCRREGFRGGSLLDVRGSLQLLNSSHVRERDKALLRVIMVGGVWNGFLLSRVRGQAVPYRFCGAPDNDGHLFCDCPFPPLVEIRENPEFHDLMRLDKGHWPRCLLWHGWLPMLSGVNGILMFGLMAVWFLIIGFLLTNLSIFGEIVGGVMLMVSALILALRAVGVFLRFLGLFSLFRELKCGVLF